MDRNCGSSLWVVVEGWYDPAVPTILVRRTRGGPKTLVQRLRTQADRMLEYLGLADAELSVVLVGDRAIQALNREHRGKDRPTDVLAFPLGRSPVKGVPRLLGDIVISLPTAARQARSRKRPLLPEARFLLAHGLLHLIGYDHATKLQKQRMDSATRRLVRAAAGFGSSRHRPAGRVGARAGKSR
jgi:probable rRNA maturation factor